MEIRAVPIAMTPGTKRGPRLRVGDRAPSATVLDVDGQLVSLSALYPHGPVLLVFLRHFGCIFCRELLAELQARHAELIGAGLVVAAIGLGEPRHARQIGGRHAPDLTVLAAPVADPYLAFGIGRASMGKVLSPRTFAAGARAALRGKMQGAPTGDQQMVGGAFVIDRDGVVRYAHYDAFPGDKPKLSRILAAARRLNPNAG